MKSKPPRPLSSRRKRKAALEEQRLHVPEIRSLGKRERALQGDVSTMEVRGSPYDGSS
jgi:hypothetical protein